MKQARTRTRLIVLDSREGGAERGLSDALRAEGFDVTAAGTLGQLIPDDVYLYVGTELDPLLRWLPAQVRPRTFYLATPGVSLHRAAGLGLGDMEHIPVAWPELARRLYALVDRAAVPEETFRSVALANLRGEAPSFLAAVELLRLYAPSEVSVLINGETGTGKELAARAIHYLSSRATGPFVPVNCGALPDMLFENELFGHQAGAYTDARRASAGLIAEAEGGTLFLDEIEALSVHGQVALLRFLQTKEYRALGGNGMRRSDVRVLAAGNTVFEEAIRQGDFREDLYYRLAVGMVTMPPLRHRNGDARLLAGEFLKAMEQTTGASRAFTPAALDFISHHHWPGNVRQLENFVARYLLIGDRAIQDDSGSAPRPPQSTGPHVSWNDERPPPMQRAKRETIEVFERSYLDALLTQTRGNLSAAAQLAQKDRSVLSRLLKKHAISKERYK